MADLLHQLKLLDFQILHFFNVTLGSPLMDQFWVFITDLHKLPWVQFGLFPALMVWLSYIYRWDILKPILVIAFAVALADAFCYRVLKANVDRQRPFQDENAPTWLRKVGEAHGNSFPSNHAANCFAGATILAWYFRRQRYYFYSFATLVAISRPALGVHYPSDVLVGSLIGISVGLLVRGLMLNRAPVLWLHTDDSESDGKSVRRRQRHRRPTGR